MNPLPIFFQPESQALIFRPDCHHLKNLIFNYRMLIDRVNSFSGKVSLSKFIPHDKCWQDTRTLIKKPVFCSLPGASKSKLDLS
jgi:hypothetical protein